MYQIPVEQFDRRVAYAWTCIRTGTANNNREFDSCFENYDGDFIVTALVRYALSQNAWDTIQDWWGGPNNPCPWRATADQYAHVPDDRLAHYAAQTRKAQGEISFRQMALL